MSSRLRFLLTILAFVSFLALLHRFDRGLGFPLYASIRGQDTVASVVARTEAKGLGLKPCEREWIRSLTMVGLKEERILEVWGLGDSGRPQLIRSFPFLGYSGRFGPKLIEGDGQIPEGVYRVEYLNPNSSYHLSIKIDYPNEFDREKGRSDERERLGYDIFIHGSSVTVGCIPIGDDAIEDLFTMVAQIGCERVSVILAPWDFRSRKDEPAIDAISWEAELYEGIRREMMPFGRP